MVWLPGEGIPKLIEHMSSPIGIEIGTDDAHTTRYLLSVRPDLTLHGVDPYLAYTDWNGSTCTQEDRDATFNRFLSVVGPFGNRYIHHRKTSNEAVNDFADNSMDFIFIDGLHEYNQVSNDLRNYYPKLKSGGLFCGHDFSVIFHAVGKPVMEFANIMNVGVKTTEQDVWYWYKP